MRNATAFALAFLLPAAALGPAACEPKEADTATTPPPEAVPDSADEWFVSEHGFRIPLQDKAEFLACVERLTAPDVAGWWELRGIAYAVGKSCVPYEAFPPGGWLSFCGDGNPVTATLHYCPDGSPPGKNAILVRRPESPQSPRFWRAPMNPHLGMDGDALN